jgi:hypothetical protein
MIKYQKELTEIDTLSERFHKELTSVDITTLSLSEMTKHIDSYTKIEKIRNQKCIELIKRFPSDVLSVFGVYFSDSKILPFASNKIDIYTIIVEENENVNKSIDFGITCF